MHLPSPHKTEGITYTLVWLQKPVCVRERHHMQNHTQNTHVHDMSFKLHCNSHEQRIDNVQNLHCEYDHECMPQVGSKYTTDDEDVIVLDDSLDSVPVTDMDQQDRYGIVYPKRYVHCKYVHAECVQYDM